jgi:TPR repeat protein
VNNFICDRLCDIEERSVSLDRSIISATNQIHILKKEFDRLLKEQSQLFESEILYRRGCEYLYGRNGSSDDAAFGFSQLKRSAELGHSDAAFECGQCQIDGRGCAKDEISGIHYFEISASDMSESTGSVADITTGRRRSRESFRLNRGNESLRFLIMGGNAKAQNRLGEYFEKGFGVVVEKNLDHAAEYYRLSAAQGNAFGQYHFGLCLENGVGVEKDLVAAAENYRLSADQGNADGQNQFGFCLDQGLGVEKDLIRAAEYYHLSVRQGHVLGQCHFGRCLENGFGIAKNLVDAAEYYRLSASQGNSDAQCRFALCLEYGYGIARDLATAAYFYKMALDQGTNCARTSYERCMGSQRS